MKNFYYWVLLLLTLAWVIASCFDKSEIIQTRADIYFVGLLVTLALQKEPK